MKVLMVYPKCPETFWSFKYALKFVSKKATHPPLGLLTIAGMMPDEWDIKLIDMNVEKLKDRHFKGVDLVFISAMSVQSESAGQVIQRCRDMGIKSVGGGPLFTTDYEKYKDVDYLILNEAEITFPLFLKDYLKGDPKHIYSSDKFCDMRESPLPRLELLKMRKYKSMSIQYSRGCPFNCEFCNVTSLFGHRVRMKSDEQIIRELSNLYKHGWRSGVFFVDDNFIGSKAELKKGLLYSIKKWMDKKDHPFSFNTQASVNLADDEELMKLMVQAGFDSVFVGIETPNEESLEECRKFQNKTRDLVSCVKAMQKSGLQVMGGFIVGFDHDNLSIFQKQIDFIQKSGIVTAMVGLLNAPKGTQLYQRLSKANRLVRDITGDNTDFSLNFIPEISCEALLNGYKNIINRIYSPKEYYDRVKQFLKEYRPVKQFRFNFSGIPEYIRLLRAFLRSVWILGIFDRARIHYWKFLIWTIFHKIKQFPLAVTYSIYGFHFRKIFDINK